MKAQHTVVITETLDPEELPSEDKSDNEVYLNAQLQEELGELFSEETSIVITTSITE